MAFSENDYIYKKISSDRYTPFTLAKKIGAKAIFESASFQNGRQRYSILMAEEAFKITQTDDGVFFIIDGKNIAFKSTEKSFDALGREKNCDVLDALNYVATQHKTLAEKIPSAKDLPIPTSGLGFLSYEFAKRCDNIRFYEQQDELKIPESLFIVGHIYIIFDHFTEDIHIFGLNYNEHKIDIALAVENLICRFNDMDFSYLSNSSEENQHFEYKIITDLEKSKAEYVKKVEELKKYIIDGDIIQAVPSRRVQIECKATALQVYGKLRKINPSPYMFYLDFGDFKLTGASPESLITVKKGVANIHPIAGTIRRGKTDGEDEKLSQELHSNSKERAEHLMLVDLARNDLGRICKSGSVKVSKYMECEKFSHLIHLVSSTEGDLRDDVKPIQALRAAFPAGTVSGAPKISAMEILSKLEKSKRGFYAGAVGYIQQNGDLDFCIAIRSVMERNGIFTLQAGGGIVYDSTPEREFTETQEKLGAVIDAITK